MSAQRYFEAAVQTLQKLASEQADALEKAAQRIVQAIFDGHALFAFGASHSFMVAEEMVYRTGGLMLANPIYPHGMNLFVRPLTLTSRLERVEGLGRELLRSAPVRRGDVLIIASTSGRNAVAIDMAMEAREVGMFLIGITSLAYTSGVTSRHSSGKKLGDLCDVVLDNGAPMGDAVVAIPGFPQPVGPISSVTGCALVNALVCEVVAKLVEAGHEPPVYMSANLDGGDEYNARLLAQYRDRVYYM